MAGSSKPDPRDTVDKEATDSPGLRFPTTPVELTDFRVLIVTHGEPAFWQRRIAEIGAKPEPACTAATLSAVSLAGIGAALVDGGTLPHEQLAIVLQVLQDAPVASIVLLGRNSAVATAVLDLPCDAILPVDADQLALATTLCSAHRRCQQRLEARHRINDLESQLETTKLLGQAKAIVARHRGTSEAEALRHLRHQARRQRKPLRQIAQLVVDADAILVCELNHNNDGAAGGGTAERPVAADDNNQPKNSQETGPRRRP